MGSLIGLAKLRIPSLPISWLVFALERLKLVLHAAASGLPSTTNCFALRRNCRARQCMQVQTSAAQSESMNTWTVVVAQRSWLVCATPASKVMHCPCLALNVALPHFTRWRQFDAAMFVAQQCGCDLFTLVWE